MAGGDSVGSIPKAVLITDRMYGNLPYKALVI